MIVALGPRRLAVAANAERRLPGWAQRRGHIPSLFGVMQPKPDKMAARRLLIVHVGVAGMEDRPVVEEEHIARLDVQPKAVTLSVLGEDLIGVLLRLAECRN